MEKEKIIPEFTTKQGRKEYTLGVPEVAQILKVSHKTIYRLAKSKKIKFGKTGEQKRGRLIFNHKDVLDYLDNIGQ